jgi:hypothetical protein
MPSVEASAHAIRTLQRISSWLFQHASERCRSFEKGGLEQMIQGRNEVLPIWLA